MSPTVARENDGGGGGVDDGGGGEPGDLLPHWRMDIGQATFTLHAMQCNAMQ